MNAFAFGASFIGTGVEFVEALTIILAVGSIRGWKSALAGSACAVVSLAALVFIVGTPLEQVIHIGWIQSVVGLLMLLFGIRWLRKAILRYAGLKSLHDEQAAYQTEIARQRKAGTVTQGVDGFAFSTTYLGTFLEGSEAIFIVIAVGLSQHDITACVYGGLAATAVVLVLGILLRSPLSRIPENTLKFIVSLMLTSLGTFWMGEGLNLAWPQNDLSIVYIVLTLLLFSKIQVGRLKNRMNPQVPNQTSAMEVSS